LALGGSLEVCVVTRVFGKIVALLLLCTVGVIAATPALAQDDDYTPPEETTVIVRPGEVEIFGANCPPNTQVDVTITLNETGEVVGTGQTESDDEGDFYLIVDTGDAEGPAQATIVCGDVTQVIDIMLVGGPTTVTTVTPVPTTVPTGAGPGRGPLPRTGSDSLPLARLAVVLMTAGGLAVYASRKRATRRARALA
jgi:hypothetical protein